MGIVYVCGGWGDSGVLTLQLTDDCDDTYNGHLTSTPRLSFIIIIIIIIINRSSLTRVKLTNNLPSTEQATKSQPKQEKNSLSFFIIFLLFKCRFVA